MILELIIKLLLAGLAAGGIAFVIYACFLAFGIVSIGAQFGEALGFWRLKRGWQDIVGFYFFNLLGLAGIALTVVFFFVFGISIVTFIIACAFITVYTLIVKHVTYQHQN